MSPDDFECNKQALSVRRLERPKKLYQLASKFWAEIVSQQYNFDRDRVEVAFLPELAKEDVLGLFKVALKSLFPLSL